MNERKEGGGGATRLGGEKGEKRAVRCAVPRALYWRVHICLLPRHHLVRAFLPFPFQSRQGKNSHPIHVIQNKVGDEIYTMKFSETKW